MIFTVIGILGEMLYENGFKNEYVYKRAKKEKFLMRPNLYIKSMMICKKGTNSIPELQLHLKHLLILHLYLFLQHLLKQQRCTLAYSSTNTWICTNHNYAVLWRLQGNIRSENWKYFFFTELEGKVLFSF